MAHQHPIGAKTVVVDCQRCKQPFTACVADRKRGWGKFCSKSCKARRQTEHSERRAHQEAFFGSLRSLGYDKPAYFEDYL